MKWLSGLFILLLVATAWSKDKEQQIQTKNDLFGENQSTLCISQNDLTKSAVFYYDSEGRVSCKT